MKATAVLRVEEPKYGVVWEFHKLSRYLPVRDQDTGSVRETGPTLILPRALPSEGSCSRERFGTANESQPGVVNSLLQFVVAVSRLAAVERIGDIAQALIAVGQKCEYFLSVHGRFSCARELAAKMCVPRVYVVRIFEWLH